MPDGQALPPAGPADGADDDPHVPQLGGVVEGHVPVLSPELCSRILSAFWAAWEVCLCCCTVGCPHVHGMLSVFWEPGGVPVML